LKSASFLKATVVHEYGHSTIDRILDANGKAIRWKYQNYRSADDDLALDGPIGYGNEILNSGNMHISRRVLTHVTNPLWHRWNLFNPGNWGSRFFHSIPQRFKQPYKPFTF